jgi:exopolyphosphatase/guanosine-5'-triphosphate,3'-diphosphate pyrophosphatase
VTAGVRKNKNRVAAIDCGTNSIRLLVADLPAPELRPAAALTDVVRRMEIVRLGAGVDRTGRLAADAIERTRVVLAEYAHQISGSGADRVRMVATSASRDAANADDFTAMVRATIGVDPEVASGDEEARLSFDGAIRGLPASEPAPYLVVDIGGGSTEFVTGAQTVDHAISIDIGGVRMTERHLLTDPPTSAEIAAAERDITAAVRHALDVVPGRDAKTLVGLAGSVTTVAAIAMGLETYDPGRTHHSRVSAADVARITDDLLGATRAQRSAIPVMHPGRADVIAAGALILRTIMGESGASVVVASEHDILDGIAWSLADRVTTA